MKLPIAILAGGLGTRLGSLTHKLPKSLIPVQGEPFAVHQIRLFKEQGFERIVFCVGHLGEQIEAVLGDGSRFGVTLEYSYDGPALLGTGGALKQAISLLGSAFFVIYGDSYLPIVYQAVETAFLTSKKQGLMTVLKNQDQWDKSNVSFENGGINLYNKAASPGTLKYIDYGLTAFSKKAFEAFREDQPFDLTDVFQSLIPSNQLAGFEVAERFYEIGSTQGLSDLEVFLSQKYQRNAR